MEGPASAFVAIVAGILIGATFAALDAALSSLGEVRLRALADGDTAEARAARRALEQLDVVRSRLLAGRVLCITIAAAVASHVAARTLGLGAVLGAAAVVALAYALVTEIATTVARQRAGRWAIAMLRWLRPLELATVPFALPLALLGRFIERRVPPANAGDPERVTELGLEQVIQEGQEEGALDEEHAELLRSVFEFKNTIAREVMVPRTQMVAIDVATSIPKVLEIVATEGHSRYPVYLDRADRIVGVLYAKDLFRVLRDRDDVSGLTLEGLIRKPPFFATEAQKIDSLLRDMQARRVHLAVVVDEFGGTSGIVTLEDILEEIVGDIHDEHDVGEPPVQEVSPGHYLVDARLSIYDLEDQLGVQLRRDEGEYESVGGMVIGIAGHVPAVGETVTTGDYLLTVRDGDQRRVRRVEIRRSAQATAQ